MERVGGWADMALLRDLFTKLANDHLARDIDVLMPWAYAQQDKDA